MIAPMLLAVFISTAGQPDSGAPAVEPVDESRFSDCVLTEIAKLENTTAEKLNAFSKRNANKAVGKCQPIKKDWAQSLDQKYAVDPKYQDPVLRHAEVNRIVSTDELAVLLMVEMKAK